MKQVILFLALCIASTPFMTHAETVLRTGSDISVESDQTVEGDYYVSAGPFGRTVMSGKVSEDMYAVGATVTINGEIGADVSLLAGTSYLHASVTDDVRVVAGEVTIADSVGGDVFVIAGSLTILSTAHVAGDIFFFGGDLKIDGPVEGSLYGSASRVNIGSQIAGDIDMTASAGLTLADTATIGGSITYTSLVPLTRGQDTQIGGSVQKNDFAAVTTREKVRDVLIPIFITLFATLSLYLLFKRNIEKVVTSIDHNFARSFMIGSLVIFAGPVISLLLMVTVLGLFVGLLTFSALLMVYIVGIALVSVVLGSFLLKFVTNELSVTLPSILLGVLSVQLLLLIPVLGPLAIYIVFALTVGAVTQRMYKTIA